jgi:hypothetical protein
MRKLPGSRWAPPNARLVWPLACNSPGQTSGGSHQRSASPGALRTVQPGKRHRQRTRADRSASPSRTTARPSARRHDEQRVEPRAIGHGGDALGTGFGPTSPACTAGGLNDGNSRVVHFATQGQSTIRRFPAGTPRLRPYRRPFVRALRPFVEEYMALIRARRLVRVIYHDDVHWTPARLSL